MSTLKSNAPRPKRVNSAVISSTVGKVKENGLPRYDVLSIPALTDAPRG